MQIYNFWKIENVQKTSYNDENIKYTKNRNNYNIWKKIVQHRNKQEPLGKPVAQT